MKQARRNLTGDARELWVTGIRNIRQQRLEEREIVTVAGYFEPALRRHLGGFLPEEARSFFAITAHYDPLPLYTHFWHWFELARMDEAPHPSLIRQGRCSTTSSTVATKAPPPASKRCCCTPASTTTAPAPARWCGSSWRSAPPGAWARSTRTPTR
jgi:hypothetical protein